MTDGHAHAQTHSNAGQKSASRSINPTSTAKKSGARTTYFIARQNIFLMPFVSNRAMLEPTLEWCEPAELVAKAYFPSREMRDDCFSKESRRACLVHVPFGGLISALPLRDLLDWIELFINTEAKSGGDGSSASFARIKVTGIAAHGEPFLIFDKDYRGEGGDLLIRHGHPCSIILPLMRPPWPDPFPSIQDSQDDGLQADLVTHLDENSAYYTRAIFLAQNAYQRATYLKTVKAPDGSSVLDHLDNRPLEIVGDYVAYPCRDRKWKKTVTDLLKPDDDTIPDKSVNERLVTLPTRGVFAEAKLGHCNASEEIDNTRFWDWQTSPIPHMAPDIAPVQTANPQAQQSNVSPTAFPQSLVNIVNPPSAPDPAGTAAALSLLGTPNIFRDMSGRAEVASLLGKLSDNSISAAQAANEAKRIQTKYGTNLQGNMGNAGTNTGDSISGSTKNAPAPLGTPRSVGEVNELATGIRNQLPPSQANALTDQLYQNVVDKTGGAAAGSLIDDPGQITGELYFSNAATGGAHLCFPVGKFQNSQFASGFGTFAERMIENDYTNTMGGNATNTYFDNNNPTAYKSFLSDHNPSLKTGPLAAKLAGSTPMRPDILCDDGIRKDYYEIKPLSPTGAVDGLAKRYAINSFMKEFTLPYVPGTAYSPSKDIPIMSGNMLGCQIGVSLNVQRYVEGIVTYTVCLTGEVAELLAKATIGAVLAWMAAIMLPMVIGEAAIA